jgi:hypothetical protein
MKKTITILAFLLLAISCEKDDICTTPNADTAHLIIKFYDQLDQETTKAVTNLLVVGVDDMGADELSYGIESTRDSIVIPLRILKNNTSYRLIKDYEIDDNGTPTDTSDDFATGNEDIIVLNYENEELFISKACGFKNVFNDVNFGFTPDADNWILSSTVITNKIETEDNAHIHIFH